MAKVYVSSTFHDLKECREQVRLVLRRMGHEDVAMEYYTAGDERPPEKCKADVVGSDLYIGMFAWRYGFRPNEDNLEDLSITEMEYRQAIESKKPCLIFLLHEDAAWPRKFVDSDGRIEGLRNELSHKHLCGFFYSAQDIGSIVGPAVHNWAKSPGHSPPAIPIPELDAYYNAICVFRRL